MSLHSVRFKVPLAQKVYIHDYLNKLEYGTLHAIDTKYMWTKKLITDHPVVQMGFDFGLKSTDYLSNATVDENDVIWLDYCCTPTQHFVIQDLKLCTSKWVFATFSLRGCKWKSQIQYIRRGTSYKVGWVYEYNDTSPMIVVAYFKDKPPPKLINPVGKKYKFLWKRKWYTRTCKKLLLPPEDDDQLYMMFRDSNEPIKNCDLVK